MLLDIKQSGAILNTQDISYFKYDEDELTLCACFKDSSRCIPITIFPDSNIAAFVVLILMATITLNLNIDDPFPLTVEKENLTEIIEFLRRNNLLNLIDEKVIIDERKI